MTFSVAAIAEAIGAIPPARASEITASGWSIDSRTVNPGDCFFALRGARDGHEFVPQAFERGASVAVVEREVNGEGAQLRVRDAEAALRRLGSRARERWGGTVVGVTGSAGKTTTKDTIAALVGTQFRTGKTIGNLNNHLGVPLSILRLPEQTRVAVLEMGMNHAEEIRTLARIARPQIGVVTNVGWAHAENFENGIDGIALAKRELIEELPPTGTAVLNEDDPRVRQFGKVHPGRTITFGFAESSEVRATDVRWLETGARFRVDNLEFESPLAGRHGVSNVLAGIAVARAMGIATESLRDAVRALAPGRMRGERIEHHGITIINDCYNANPEAVRSMMEVLRDAPARRRIAVLGEMLELGREAENLHRGIGKFAAEQRIDALVGVRGAARAMVESAIESGMSDGAALFFETPESAGDYLREFLRPGDTVLFKGSRGVAMERALERVLGNEAREEHGAPAGTAWKN